VRAGVGLVALAVTLGVIFAGLGASRSRTNGSRTAGSRATGSQAGGATPGRPGLGSGGLPAVESGLLPWRLPAPLSREVAAPGPRGRLLLLGGLRSGGASTGGVLAVNPATGHARAAGALARPLHDAAGTLLRGHELIFGGGAQASVATVQEFNPPAPGRAAGRVTATVTGALPAARSDAASVTIGDTGYLVAGYTGTRADAEVLATSDGRSFRAVAALPVPVRYPAVAALGGTIFAFGGEAVTGPGAGQPVDAIQAIDPARHTASIIGRLPEPLAGAAAVVIGGHLFVAGGESSVAQTRVPGLGSTQLGPAAVSRYPGPGTTAHSSVTSTVSTIWAFDPASKRLLPAGHLQVPVSHAGIAVIGSTAWIAGGESGSAPVAAVQMLRPDRAFGRAGAPGAGSPYFGARLLIADRGNNRLLLLDDRLHVVWKYPSATSPRDRLRFYFPDDAFFAHHGRAIISNQEQNETIVEIAYPSGKIIWSYGHPRQPGTARGYLHEPDDAYLLRSGQVTVADAQNCRVLVLNRNGTVAHQIGTSGVCVHHPPASMGSPNGDTPLADGNLLISEINGSWVSEYRPTGSLVWTVRLPIAYPSDPQQLGPDRYLIADYASPGQILEFNRSGRILYRYAVAHGPGRLDHPSLAEMLPSGVIMANDDYSDRMVAIDPATRALVWQYGVTGRPGTRPGRLNIPDGFDLLLPNGSTPTHRSTG
jgi:PQQ-like domain